MRTIIAGTRKGISDWEFLYYIERLPWEITVGICGCAKGVDTIGARYVASQLHLPVEHYPADWDKYGKAAGPIRNKAMADVAEALVAFPKGESRGTRNMIKVARDMGLRIVVFEISLL